MNSVLVAAPSFSLLDAGVVWCGVVWQEEELKDAILLVFANKQDQPGSLSSTEVCMKKTRRNGRSNLRAVGFCFAGLMGGREAGNLARW